VAHRNATIESFWTHARCLMEFFSRRKNQDFTASAASAMDFTEGFRPSSEMEKLWGPGRPTDWSFISPKRCQKGADWYKWIKDRLVESRMLLLLFTDNTGPWDWCLYEAGLFTQWDDDQRRIICLHTGRHPPAPLKHLQLVPALREEIALFLRQLLVETELTGLQSPLNAMLATNPADTSQNTSTSMLSVRHGWGRKAFPMMP
jgi:hypothetical protein